MHIYVDKASPQGNKHHFEKMNIKTQTKKKYNDNIHVFLGP